MKVCVLKSSRAADHGQRCVISFVSPLCKLKGWWVTEWHWPFSDWWNAIALMQSSLIAFSYVCFAVIKPTMQACTLEYTEVDGNGTLQGRRESRVKKIKKRRFAADVSIHWKAAPRFPTFLYNFSMIQLFPHPRKLTLLIPIHQTNRLGFLYVCKLTRVGMQAGVR